MPPQLIGRQGALREHELVVNSSVDFLVENRREMLYDQYEIYRRGKEDAPRPELTGPLPFPGTPEEHDYMTPYPRAHVIPVGAGQRSDAEAKRLVDFLLANDIEVRQLRRDYRFGGRTFQAGSYVVFLNQSLRALGNTMLDVGDDISDRVSELYAPPGAWSNGFLWGADVVTIGRDRRFSPNTSPVEADRCGRGRRPRRALRLARARGRLADRGSHRQRADRARASRHGSRSSRSRRATAICPRAASCSPRARALSSAPPVARRASGSSP